LRFTHDMMTGRDDLLWLSALLGEGMFEPAASCCWFRSSALITCINTRSMRVPIHGYCTLSLAFPPDINEIVICRTLLYFIKSNRSVQVDPNKLKEPHVGSVLLNPAVSYINPLSSFPCPFFLTPILSLNTQLSLIFNMCYIFGSVQVTTSVCPMCTVFKPSGAR
jgi:hypothetical protein